MKCKEECAKNEHCVAFSGIWSVWCVGCKVELGTIHEGAISYKKKGTLIFKLKNIVFESFTLLISSVLNFLYIKQICRLLQQHLEVQLKRQHLEHQAQSLLQWHRQ